MVRRGQNLCGPYGYVITQVYRKVPITINPVHRSRVSQHPWLPMRSTKLAVGASGTHRTPTTNRASTVAFYDPWRHTGMGILAPPSQGIVCIFIWRCIPSEIISQLEPGVVFEQSLLHSKLEYPDLPQPPKCLPVTAVDRHQGNMTKSDQTGVYRAHRGP
jgi:hypothetical protein